MSPTAKGRKLGTIFEYTTLIREHHLDTYGHINNATYVALFEEARWEWVTQHGFGLKRVHKEQLGPVILEFNLRFTKEVTNREQITIASQVPSYKGKIFNIEQILYDENRQVCCQGNFVAGIMDLKARKLVKLPMDWMKAMGMREG